MKTKLFSYTKTEKKAVEKFLEECNDVIDHGLDKKKSAGVVDEMIKVGLVKAKDKERYLDEKMMDLRKIRVFLRAVSQEM